MLVEIDGEDVTGECERVVFRTPRLVYEENNGHAVLRFLGPAGFQLTLINPSERLLALADGGVAVRQVTLTSRGYSITHPVQFHKRWRCGDEWKVFGCLFRAPSSEARWIPSAGLQAADFSERV